MEVRLVTVITSYVIALSAPSTGKRCRPLGALIQHRAKHQRYPKNAPKTKCAASTKKTVRLPACASARRGSNFFLILLLHLRVACGGQPPDLTTLQPEVFEKEANLGGTAFDASQGCEHRDRFVDGLRRMRPYLRFNRVPMRTQQALWAMEVELFQRFHTACVIQFEIGSQGIGRDGTQLCNLVRW